MYGIIKQGDAAKLLSVDEELDERALEVINTTVIPKAHLLQIHSGYEIDVRPELTDRVHYILTRAGWNVSKINSHTLQISLIKRLHITKDKIRIATAVMNFMLCLFCLISLALLAPLPTVVGGPILFMMFIGMAMSLIGGLLTTMEKW